MDTNAVLVKKRGRRIVKILRPLPVGRCRFLFNFKTVLKSTSPWVSLFCLDIRILHVFAAMEGDEFLTGGEIVAKQGIEDLLGLLCVGGGY